MSYLLGGGSSLGPGTGLIERFDGMGCAANCSCGGTCAGMGFFDSGADISGWGILEWVAAGLGTYMVLSTVFTTRRAVKTVRKSARRARRRMAPKVATA